MSFYSAVQRFSHNIYLYNGIAKSYKHYNTYMMLKTQFKHLSAFHVPILQAYFCKLYEKYAVEVWVSRLAILFLKYSLKTTLAIPLKNTNYFDYTCTCAGYNSQHYI
jgi:hypothetical protein